MSSNGRCCSTVWPEVRRYAVYAQGSSDEWRKVDEESGTSVAWAGASSTYAVLHQPKVGCMPLPVAQLWPWFSAEPRLSGTLHGSLRVLWK